jgi:KDO2-lipid IV(A) lauroyltransferase
VNEKYRFTFLNQATAMFNGVEKLSIGTDSVVVYIHVRMDSRGHYTLTFQPLCENPKETAETEITRKYAALLEANIREQPHLWLWTHRRWKR